MSLTHRIIFAFEILLAELIFLLPCEKRNGFAFRLLGGTLITTLASYLFIFMIPGVPVPALQFFRLILVFFVSIGSMFFCFRLPLRTVAAACAAGYALEHMTFHMVKILAMTTPVMQQSLWGLPRWEAMEYVFFPPLYLLWAVTIGVYSARNQCFRQTDRRLTLVFFSILLTTIGFTRIADALGENASVTVSLYAVACCIMALTVQLILFHEMNLKVENDTIHMLWREDHRQYELNKKTIETMNIKHHDLKHRLSEINAMLSAEDIHSIEEAVGIYGSRIKAGYEALDVLLTQRSLICNAEGIMLTYTGNGADFSFMSTTEAYSLFGNAIDNAIEAVRKVNDPQKKVIDIVTECKGDMRTIMVTNYYEEKPRFFQGLPMTSKKEEEGFHGFGMKSMKTLAEKYHGSINVRLKDDLFVLSIVLFVDHAKEAG